jgi:hypothetical protein
LPLTLNRVIGAGEPFEYCDGNTWEPFVNAYQQRQLRCIAGRRKGDVIHDPRLGEYAGRSVSSRDSVQSVRDLWVDGLFRRDLSVDGE